MSPTQDAWPGPPQVMPPPLPKHERLDRYLARAMEELSTGHPKEVQAMPLIQRAIQTLRKTARDHDSDTFPSTKIVK